MGRFPFVIGFTWLCARTGFSFPIDQFTDFINNKPTVEKLVFRIKTTKYVIPEATEDTARQFHLTFDQNGAFELIENGKSYITNAPIRFWGRYGTLYWRVFNSNDVITTEAPVSRAHLRSTSDPYPSINGNLGIGLDALNLGIIDLDYGHLTWSGMSFTGSSRIGAKIEGQLLIDQHGQPSGMQMLYNYNGNSYQYRTQYEFDRSRGLPDYFPSRIKIEALGKSGPKLVSDYEIVEASFSRRKLELADVAYSSLLSSNSSHFVFSNDTTYAVKRLPSGAARLQRVVSAASLVPTRRHTRLFAFIFLAISLSFVALLIKTTRNQRKE
jgi:hypothetical protein